MKLTDHFTLEELTDSDTAVRLGIDNTPPPAIRPHLEVLAQGLEEVRRILGQPIIVRSGYRCEALEKVLCAKDYAAWCERHGRPLAAACRNISRANRTLAATPRTSFARASAHRSRSCAR
jgi:hypothetical protein